jgi:hypothetical protein
MMEIFTNSLQGSTMVAQPMNANNNEVLMEERIKEIEEDKILELQIT